MKKFVMLAIIIATTLSLAAVAGATSYSFQPDDGSGNPSDLWDLDHGRAYTWGIDWEVPTEEEIVGATLSFDNIRNWRTEENDLWVRLLDSVEAGAHQYRDGYSSQTDYFAGQGTPINHWEDLPATAQDITYTFDADEIQVLSQYIMNDGNFGLSFDPDCHFYNDGIELTIETAAVSPVPEPSTVLLLGCGILGLIGISRKRIKK
jgi:hypothetical protein